MCYVLALSLLPKWRKLNWGKKKLKKLKSTYCHMEGTLRLGAHPLSTRPLGILHKSSSLKMSAEILPPLSGPPATLAIVLTLHCGNIYSLIKLLQQQAVFQAASYSVTPQPFREPRHQSHIQDAPPGVYHQLIGWTISLLSYKPSFILYLAMSLNLSVFTAILS